MNDAPENDPTGEMIHGEETVTFFPTYGYRDGSDRWNLQVHGWIYRPRRKSLRRAALLGLVRRALRLSGDAAESALMKQRLLAFLVNNQPGKRISIRIGSAIHRLAESAANGHFRTTLHLGEEAALASETGQPEPDGTRRVTFSVSTSDEHGRQFSGEVRLIPERGVSVISDVDDTVKITNVPDRRELLANTFLREFRAAPGMAETYRRWAAAGCCFHYVSASPWQLYHPLESMLAGEGFAEGTIHLRNFRVKDRSLVDFLAENDEAKRRVIQRIMRHFPQRRFVLVGDSGERDPELYAALARSFPRQVQRIFIRNVTGESRDSERFRRAFAEFPQKDWTLFDAAMGIDRDVDVCL